MALPLIFSVTDILEAQVEGRYRWVALGPSVRVGPMTERGTIVVHAGPDLTLLGGTSRSLSGMSSTLDFEVIDDGPELHLREVSRPFSTLDPIDQRSQAMERTPPRHRHPTPRRLAPIPAQEVPEGRSVAPLPTPVRRARLIVDPDEAPAPPALDVSIPDYLREWCGQEDIHPELGDYLVIPASQIEHYQPWRDWFATTPYIETVQVVKPREERNAHG